MGRVPAQHAGATRCARGTCPTPCCSVASRGIGRTFTDDLPATSRAYTIENGTTDVTLQDYHLATRAEIGAFQRLTASLYVGRHGVGTVTEARPELSPLEQGSTAIINSVEQQVTRATDTYLWRTVAGQVKHEQLHGSRVTHTLQLRGSEHTSTTTTRSPSARPRSRRIRRVATAIGCASSPPSGGVQVAGGGRWDLDLGSGGRLHARPCSTCGNGVLRALGSDERAWRVAGHAEARRRVGRRLWLDGGLRVTQLLGSGRAFLEPRIALRADGESAEWGPWAWRVGGGRVPPVREPVRRRHVQPHGARAERALLAADRRARGCGHGLSPVR